MNLKGESINLFLIDRDADGCIKCTLSNWTGVAYKLPRSRLDRYREISDLKQTGVYFLFGVSEQTGKAVVYIGQAGIRKNGEGILTRLLEHRRNSKKDYWSEAIVFTSSNNSLGATEISYLENRFCNLAKEANQYEVKNGNEPTPGNVTPEKESELDGFIERAKMIIAAIGNKVFIPKVIENESSDDEPILFLSRTIKQLGKQINAKGKQTTEGFVMLKSSYISSIDDDTIPTSLKELRKKANISSDHILQEDMCFSSPSYAAMFVVGKSTNGLTSWKNKDGKTLKDLENVN